VDVEYERRVRRLVMAWLESVDMAHSRLFRREDLRGFVVDGRPLALMNEQGGICKPRRLSAALSIRTTFTPPGARPPYQDVPGQDGLLRYQYRGTNPDAWDNVAVRQAWRQGLSLIWFFGVQPGLYLPIYPVWVVGEERDALRFVLAFEDQLLVPVGEVLDPDRRAWVERITKQRVHQARFRADVLHAYEYRCAMCRLAVPTLLDAAHILPDQHPRGQPIVENGLTLCKIHHAAFDQNLVGVRPDLVVVLRPDLAAMNDGPMLEHGLKDLDGARLTVPVRRQSAPDPDRLAERFREFSGIA